MWEGSKKEMVNRNKYDFWIVLILFGISLMEITRFKKTDTIKKTAKTESVFNSNKLENAIEIPIYEYNDCWRKIHFEKYGDVWDAPEEIIDELDVPSQGVNDSAVGDL